MTVTIKVVMNQKDIADQDKLIYDIKQNNHINPYSPYEVPQRLKPDYAKAEFHFKLSNLINFHTEPDEDRDMILNIAGYGVVIAQYEPTQENTMQVFLNAG